MQIRESNFFATQIPSSQRYQDRRDDNTISCQLSVDKKHPSIRIRQAKSEAKKVAMIYNQALKQYLKTKNSVDKSNSKTHKLRQQFIKLYGNKKNKFMNKSILENKRQLDQQHELQTSNRVRTLKLNNELGLLYTKNECQQLNFRLKQQNRRFDETFKKKLKLKKMQEERQARQKFQLIKKGQTEFMIRKKNMSAMVSTRAHHNYLIKLTQQMQVLQSYSKLLEKVNNFKDISDQINKQQSDVFSKTFFVTTKNSLS